MISFFVRIVNGKIVLLFAKKCVLHETFVDKLVLFARNYLLRPNLNSPQRKLLHQNVPMIQVGVVCAPWNFYISYFLLRSRSKSRNTFASTLLGRLPFERQPFLSRRAYNCDSWAEHSKQEYFFMLLQLEPTQRTILVVLNAQKYSFNIYSFLAQLPNAHFFKPLNPKTDPLCSGPQQIGKQNEQGNMVEDRSIKSVAIKVVVMGRADGETQRDYRHVDVGPSGFLLYVVLTLRVAHTARQRYPFLWNCWIFAHPSGWRFGDPKSTLFDVFNPASSHSRISFFILLQVAFIKSQKSTFGDFNLAMASGNAVRAVTHN